MQLALVFLLNIIQVVGLMLKVAWMIWLVIITPMQLSLVIVPMPKKIMTVMEIVLQMLTVQVNVAVTLWKMNVVSAMVLVPTLNAGMVPWSVIPMIAQISQVEL